MSFRESVSLGDCDAVYRIVNSSGFFSEEEMAIAVELVQERLDKGRLSGYHFLFAETKKKMAGYSCYGPIPGTKDRYDIYWIAVDEGFRRAGLGEQILNLTEEKIAGLGGKRVYVDTSSRPLYEPTRLFYEKCGYRKEAVLKDFYAEGDSKIIYSKSL